MIKPLTSLRFFFAFFVFLSHLGFLKSDIRYKYIFEKFFDEGFLGVSFFFILSGFILAYNYNSKIIENNISKTKFYIARFARIYPLHLITLIIAIPISLFEVSKSLPFNLLLLQSWIPVKTIYFSFNSPSWSISTEAFFYLCFPFLIPLNNRLSTIKRVAIIILFILIIFYLNSVLSTDQIHYWLYISPIIKIFDFILGIFMFQIFIYFKENPPERYFVRISFLLSISVFFIFFYFHDKFDLGLRYSIYYWIPMFSIILFSAVNSISVYNSGIFIKFLSSRSMIYLGEISFSFYLLHQLVIRFYIGFDKIFNFNINLILVSICLFIITAVSSSIAFEFIEKPINKIIKKKLYDKIS